MLSFQGSQGRGSDQGELSAGFGRDGGVHCATEEAAYIAGGGVEGVFQQEVAAVQQVDFRLGQITRERRSPVGPEDLIALAPDREQRDLAGPEVLLDGGVERRG